MSLLIAGGVDYMTSKGPFQPKLFYDSMVDSSVTATEWAAWASASRTGVTTGYCQFTDLKCFSLCS